MEKSKLKKLAGIKESSTIIQHDGEIVFDSEKIVDKLESIKSEIKLNKPDPKLILLLDKISEKLDKNDKNLLILNKNTQKERKKDTESTNLVLSKLQKSIIKLETPFIWLKDYFDKIIDYLKEIIFFFEKPRETILIKKDGRVSEIVYKYSDREVIEKITRNIGETRFIRDERRNI